MKDKDWLLINNVNRNLADLSIHRLLSKFNIHQVQIDYVGNLQYHQKILKNQFWRGLVYKINKTK